MSSAGQPLTVREVLRLFWQADSYPCLGNGDIRVADRLEEEALAKATDAVPQPDDPPEFTHWLAALRERSPRHPERDTIMESLYDLFDPESDAS